MDKKEALRLKDAYQAVSRTIRGTGELHVRAGQNTGDKTNYVLEDPELIAMINTWLTLKVGSLSRIINE